MKKFEQFGSDEENRIEELENAIIKRNELIYVMMRNLSHGYQNFMISPIDVDDLYKMFKVEELMEDNKHRKFVTNKIEMLGRDVFK